MKKRIVVFVFMLLCCMCACGKGNKGQETGTVNTNPESETANADEYNRSVIAEAFDGEEDSRNIKFILSSLETIGAGRIQSAECTEVDGESVLHLVAEDGTEYRIYLSESGNVEAVENLNTGEWPLQSDK